MTTPSELLKKYNVRPRKRLGQSFLVDGNVIGKIVRAADIRSGDTVVEIGAGIGFMTALLAERARRLTAIELDPDLVKVLREELRGCGNIEIVEGDILKYDFSRARSGGPSDGAVKLKVIGNIPYNISTEVLFRLIDCRNMISAAVLMFQKEVGERITARPGTKQYGVLSVLAGMFLLPTRVMTVPRTCFFPVPDVDSVVLKLEVRNKPLVPLSDEGFFFQVVRTAFSKRRKTLYNNLKMMTAAVPAAELLERIGIDPGRRGETLSIEEFGKLANAIKTEVEKLRG
ncbi:MAG TPA: 16S rRNA (adenine(1518)-N(6)/adenine(1519)-N(6))-dimethyltransferase RsmA [Syntrophales bacterium]|nr:16S rRNA (adenine(1518)-N(6)/adenine(1519)-N(6))-dimethyltransferase RsmA [Syntrophales bacterium]